MKLSNKNNIEEAYEAYLEPMKIKSTRFFSLLGALLYSVFIIADVYALPSNFTDALVIRVGVVFLLLMTCALSFSENIAKYYDLILGCVSLSAGLGVIAMIFISDPTDHASSVYFVGLILVIMTLIGWSFISTIVSTLILFTLIASYAFVCLFKGMVIPELLVNLLFFFGAITIGVISQKLRDSFLREIFMLKESISQSLKEKTVEASNNAHLANHDVLTGLPNRRYMMNLLEGQLNNAKKNNKTLALLFIDLDGFKQINDTHSHAVGDEVLKIVAQRLSLTIDKGDCLSRLGGDEFLIGIIFNKRYLPCLDNILNRYRETVSKPMKIADKNLCVGASIGVASYPADGENISTLMSFADKNMYEVKHIDKQGDCLSGAVVSYKVV